MMQLLPIFLTQFVMKVAEGETWQSCSPMLSPSLVKVKVLQTYISSSNLSQVS